MCNNSSDNSTSVPTSSAIVPYSLKSLQAAVAAAAAATASDPTNTAAAAYMAASIHHNPAAHLTQAALDHYRMQLYNYVSYADRLRYAHHHQHPANQPLALATSAHHHHHPYAGPHTLVPMQTSAGHVAADVYALTSPYAKFDPCRAYRLHQEEPKPQHSYIGLIGMAILSSPDKKLVLSDIYQYILDNYSYFRNRGPGWRNSIRHNLSLNDCFVKAGRSANGKGHFWAIHPANLEDFKKGDFRRRKAQRRVRKHLGLSVPEDDDSISPPPPPTAAISPPSHTTTLQQHDHQQNLQQSWSEKPDSTTSGNYTKTSLIPVTKKRRQFDMDSILAPEKRHCCNCNEEHSGSIVCCNDIHCSSNSLFGTIFKASAASNNVHSKAAAASTTWIESDVNKAEVEKSCDDVAMLAKRKTDNVTLVDECSSSSGVTEVNPGWSLPVGDQEEEMGSDSRPNSRNSSSGSSCSNDSDYSVKQQAASTTVKREKVIIDKGLSVIKGPKECPSDSGLFEHFHHRQTAYLSTSLTINPASNNEPLLTVSGGPLALISTGRPNSHSNSVSATIVSENQT